MRKSVLGLALLMGTFASAQIKTPRLSPEGEIEQTIGLTEIEIEYSRPSKRDRVIFGDLEPYDQVWRTGANKNSLFTTSTDVYFGKDTLKAGTYALFTLPSKEKWDLIFYTETENWGTPEEWDEAKVALRTSSPVKKLTDIVETFTISFDNLTLNDAVLSLSWDQIRVSFPFSVPTRALVTDNIQKELSGPAANDYYAAADYYYNEKIDLNQALIWINKYIEMKGDATPFYVYRKKSLIQAEMGDKKGAIESAKLSLAGAEKAGNNGYVEMNKKSIEEWSKKK